MLRTNIINWVHTLKRYKMNEKLCNDIIDILDIHPVLDPIQGFQ